MKVPAQVLGKFRLRAQHRCIADACKQRCALDLLKHVRALAWQARAWTAAIAKARARISAAAGDRVRSVAGLGAAADESSWLRTPGLWRCATGQRILLAPTH